MPSIDLDDDLDNGFDYFGPDPGMDYSYLPDEPWNPLMESSRHSQWITLLVHAIRNTTAHTDALVSGNLPFLLNDGGPHLAPDVIVIPGARDRHFDRYDPIQAKNVVPSFCLEILSKRNTKAKMAQRNRRLLEVGVDEVYMLNPRKSPETVVRVSLRDGELVEDNAVGMHSAAANITFSRVGDELGICCPGGRMVTFNTDPYGWVKDETWRADQAELRAEMLAAAHDEAAQRADLAAQRADELAQRVAELEATLRGLGHEP